MMESKRTIRSIAEIRALVRDINLKSMGNATPLEVIIDEFSTEENHQLTKELNILYSACGCAQGRTTGVIALVLFIVFVLSGIIPFQEYGATKTMVIFSGFALLSMLLGKIYGLIKGRRSLLKFADKVENQLHQKTS